MAWIESHQSIERHPKTIDLMSYMGWDIDTTVGKLHRFWWWCQDYAEDGDLRKYDSSRIGRAVGLNGEDSKKFVEAMVRSTYLDEKPYFRVHDWWDYIGSFLRSKYKHKGEKWQYVKELYKGKDNPSKNGSKGGSKNLKPNHPNHPNLTILFAAFWESYPSRNGKKLEKEKTLERFSGLREEDQRLCIQAAKNYAASELVQKGIGIKDPKRFIYNREGEYWREWTEPETGGESSGPTEYMKKLYEEKYGDKS